MIQKSNNAMQCNAIQILIAMDKQKQIVFLSKNLDVLLTDNSDFQCVDIENLLRLKRIRLLDIHSRLIS
jgi:hypothetical protein